MNASLEYLLSLFLKLIFLNWIIWSIVGIVMLLALIYIYLDDRYDISKFLISTIPIIVIALGFKNILSRPEIIELAPIFIELNKISELTLIAFGLLLALSTWNFIKES